MKTLFAAVRPLGLACALWTPVVQTAHAQDAPTEPAPAPEAPPATPAEGSQATPPADPGTPPAEAESPEAAQSADATPAAATPTTAEPPANAQAQGATPATPAPDATSPATAAATAPVMEGTAAAQPPAAAPPAAAAPATEDSAPQDPPALPPTRFVVGIGGQGSWYHDRGYERFGEQRAGQLHVFAGADLFRPVQALALAVEVDFEHGRQRGSEGLGGADGSLTSQSVLAAFVPRYEVTPWLWPHLRVGVGALGSELHLDANAGASFDDTDWTYAVDLAAGTTFALPRKIRRKQLRVQPQLRVEAGYRFAGDATFRTTEQGASGSIPVNRADLGTLQRGAILLRGTVGVRF